MCFSYFLGDENIKQDETIAYFVWLWLADSISTPITDTRHDLSFRLTKHNQTNRASACPSFYILTPGFFSVWANRVILKYLHYTLTASFLLGGVMTSVPWLHPSPSSTKEKTVLFITFSLGPSRVIAPNVKKRGCFRKRLRINLTLLI